jgi:xanthine dehydrogenase accessory factor
VTAEELDRLRGPIGLDLGGRAPAETALAILAEVVAERYGGSGVPMRELAAKVRFVSEPTAVTAVTAG